MPPFILGLLSQGLGLVANAALAKGTEFIKEKTGIDIQAGQMTPEQLTALKQFELEHEEELRRLALEDRRIDLEQMKIIGQVAMAEDAAVTDRWKADMQSDSSLSKNIRPLTLVYILTAYLVFALMSASGINVNESYVQLLGQWGMLVMTAYFGGRTVEKVMEMRLKKGGE